MSEQEFEELTNLEIEPLSDGDLEAVAGGGDSDGCSHCNYPRSYCTGFEPEEEISEL